MYAWMDPAILFTLRSEMLFADKNKRRLNNVVLGSDLLCIGLRINEVRIMIKLTRIDGSELTVNANLIEVVEATPDTVVTLITSRKLLVKESPEEIVQATIEHYKQTGGPRIIVYGSQAQHAEDHINP